MKYYLIAGEASGDIHGSNLMQALRGADPEAVFRFWGGDRMARIGGTPVRHYRDTAYMGFSEVIRNLSSIFENLKFCRNDIRRFDPDALILIDYPGFNIRIARWMRKEKLRARVIYYISPQVWAWKAGRANLLREVVDRMLVILPFEKAFYASYNFAVDYVGHPLLDHLESIDYPVPLMHKYQLPAKPVIALLPGSRRQEISNHLPVMAAIVQEFPDYQFVVGAVGTVPYEIYAPVQQLPGVRVVVDDTNLLLKASSAALVASGTATLETALMGVPLVVCYRGSALNYLLAKRLIKVKYISLVNLILDRPLVKELIQDAFKADALKEALSETLSPEGSQRLAAGYQELRRLLGERGASERAARIIVDTL